MDVSTRDDAAPDVGMRRGARHCLRLIALFAPTFLPLLPCAFALICLPWLDSLEAQLENDMVLLRGDALTRQVLATWSDGLGGSAGLLAIGLLFVALWLLLLRHWRAWSPTLVVRAILARHGIPRSSIILAVACAVLATASIQAGAAPLARWVDIAAGLRPTGAASLVAVALSQGAVLLLLGGCAGGIVAALETARMPRARVGALGVLLALGVVGGVSQGLATAWLAGRIDAFRTLPDVLHAPPIALPRVDALILARDRSWRIAVQSGLGDLPYDAEVAKRATAWLTARDGWTLLGQRLEAYAAGERLLALDPVGARAVALEALARRRESRAAHPLLASLGAAHPDAASRAMLAELADARWLERGPLALHLIARAAGMQGDRGRAERALAQLRALDGERRLASVRAVPPIVLADVTDGSVRGRLLLDGAPLTGRVGLMSTQHLFELPARDLAVPVTWLLRLGDAVPIGPDGEFTFSDVGSGEHALVLLDQGLLAGATPPAVPSIVITPANRVVDVGEIRLTR